MPVHVMGGARGSVPPRLAGRLGRAAVLAFVLLIASALPASAHAVGGAEPTNYQTRILGVTPSVPGLTIRVVEAGARLELINDTGQQVVVPGYNGEPYLRVGPDGIEENTRSPATYLNRSVDASTPPPPEANPQAEPEWRKVADGNRVAWHDHRTHWMGTDPPPQVQQAPGREHVIYPEWKLDLRQGDQVVTVTGDLRWVPGPSAAPWFAGAAVLAIALLLASRTPAWLPTLAGALVLLIAVDIVHTLIVWSGIAGSVTTKLYGSIVPVAGWLVAAVALLRLRSGVRESGIFFALFAAALALVSVLGDLSTLWSSQLVGNSPEWLTRATIAARLGLAAGIAIAGLIALRRSGMPSGAAPSTGPAAAAVLGAVALAGGLLVAGATPASAHDSRVLLKAEAAALPGQGTVRVVVAAIYPDGHRVGGLKLRAVANGGGGRQATFPLRATQQRGTYTGTAKLRPGTWTIRITASGKATGKATIRNVRVPEPAAATTAPPASTAPSGTDPLGTQERQAGAAPVTTPTTTTTALAAEPAAATGDGAPMGAIAGGLTAAGVAALAVGALVLRRSSRA